MSSRTYVAFEREFPDLGAAAHWQFLGMGPGGSAEKLVFVTEDKRYDVQVVASHALPISAKPPEVGIERFARSINGLYNESLNKSSRSSR